MKRKGVRAVLNLNGKWNYRKDPDRKGEEQKLYDPGSSRKDWGEMEIPVNWYNTEVGDYHGVIWFAKDFELPTVAKGREHTLRFNAVDYIGEVWLNGEYLGRHEGFFAPFEFRVTDFVKSGKNTVIIKVDSPFDETEYKLVAEVRRLSHGGRLIHAVFGPMGDATRDRLISFVLSQRRRKIA